MFASKITVGKIDSLEIEGADLILHFNEESPQDSVFLSKAQAVELIEELRRALTEFPDEQTQQGNNTTLQSHP